MNIVYLSKRLEIQEDIKLSKVYFQFEKLIDELRTKQLSDDVVGFINVNIEELNLIFGKNFKKQIIKRQAKIIELVEKEHKIVPMKYYSRIWLAVGMAAFGLPIGVAFGASMGNMAFLGIGLPIGMVIGMAVGARMDKKALEEGRQLDWEQLY